MNSLSRIAALLVAIAVLVVALAPAALADSGSLGGSFNVGDNASSVSPAAPSEVDWDPTYQYSVSVPVEDQDKMKDVSSVAITLYRDGYSGQPDPTSMVVMRWDRDGSSQNGTPSIEGAGSGSYPWSLDDVDVPPAGQKTGEWVFTLTVADVAREGQWHIDAAVVSNGQVSYGSASNVNMNWYGRIQVNTPSVAWGELAVGSTDNASDDISVTYVANGDYQVSMGSSQTWSGLDGNAATLIGSGAPTGTEIALRGNVSADMSGATQLGASPATVDATGVATDENGATVDTNKLWLDLGDGFAKDTYSGTITFVMGNR